MQQKIKIRSLFLSFDYVWKVSDSSYSQNPIEKDHCEVLTMMKIPSSEYVRCSKSQVLNLHNNRNPEYRLFRMIEIPSTRVSDRWNSREQKDRFQSEIYSSKFWVYLHFRPGDLLPSQMTAERSHTNIPLIKTCRMLDRFTYIKKINVLQHL